MRTHLVLFIFFFALIPTIVRAQTQDDSGYRIKVNSIQYDEPSPIPHVSNTDTVLYDTDAIEFEQHGYVIHTALPSGLTMNLSQMRINADPQPMDTVLESSLNVAVSSDTLYSYDLIAVQQRPLGTENGATIENTGCDVSSLPCTPSLGRPWNSPGSYGFGYRLKGDDTDSDFHDGFNYRPFPLNSKNQSPSILMQNINVKGTRQTQLFIKTVIPPSFQEGTYLGDISLITLPKL